MKKMCCFLLNCILLFTLCACSVKRKVSPDSPCYYPPDVDANMSCNIDVTQPGKYISNKLKMVNFWNRDTFSADAESMTKEFLEQNLPFVEVFEIMTATGGNESLDLFKDPLNYDITDDYDFTKLITACRKIVDLGLRPSLKLGNVPLKLTGKPLEGGHFDVTINPPYNYDLYYNYIHALTQALADEFGKEAVAAWRFGVLTEYDNGAWYQAPTGDYCKLYDYTTAALQDVLGENIYVGAHSESTGPTPQAFIKHCAVEKNYKTGKIGSPLKYLDVSYYMPFPNGEIHNFYKVEELRECAEKYGLTELEYGIGEGRILFGTDGIPLLGRATLKTYQAAFDAALYVNSVEEDVDYISAWPSFTTNANGLSEGLPCINLHMANLFYKMVGTTTVPFERGGAVAGLCQIDSLCSYDAENQKIYIMTYNCTSRGNPKNDMAYNITMPIESGKAKVTKYVLDDNCNFYDDWLEDMPDLGVTFDDYHPLWSSESPMQRLILTNTAITKFESKIADYEQASRLIPTQDTISFENASLQLYHDFAANTVVFYEIEIIK